MGGMSSGNYMDAILDVDPFPLERFHQTFSVLVIADDYHNGGLYTQACAGYGNIGCASAGGGSIKVWGAQDHSGLTRLGGAVYRHYMIKTGVARNDEVEAHAALPLYLSRTEINISNKTTMI